jgi:hypothetical protein
VQALGVAAARHHAAGELVDDDDLVLARLGVEADDVVLVLREERVRAQRLVHVVDDRRVVRLVERAVLEDAGGCEQLLDPLRAVLGERHRALLEIDLVIARRELGHFGVDRDVELGLVLGRPGDDEGRACLVDQDRVHLVDDGVGVAALHHLPEVVLHVVAQVVEAELVVRAVGDVAGVGGAALVVVQAVDDDADRHAEEAVDAAHPLRVALGEIVVDGHDMHALAGERIEVDGRGGDERLALARLHLGDAALVQHHAADHLHVEVALAERALGGLAYGGESGSEDVVERLAACKLSLERLGAGAQRVI